MKSEYLQLSARLVLCICLLLAACSTASTVVTHVWSDRDRLPGSMGKTLVLAVPFNPASEVGTRAENAWVLHLRGLGIDARAWSRLMPGDPVPEKRNLAALVGDLGFDTVLVMRVVELKRVERDTPASQVAVVETKLYDGSNGRAFWLAQSDTYLISHTGEEIRYPRESAIREYVEVVGREMSGSGIL